MGSIGTSITTTTKFEYEEPLLSAGKPTQASRDIFYENYRAAQRLVQGSEDKNFAMSSLYMNDEMASMSTQTLKGVQYLINQERETLDVDRDFGVIDETKANTLKNALNVVQKTLNNQWKNR